MNKKTPFYDLHLKSDAKIVDFSGWEMPLHYGSQLNEHHQVRNKVGMFDVSHMGIVDIEGSEAALFLKRILANNIDRLSIGKALYTCMLNEAGGVIDDLIVYQRESALYRLVINAGTRDKDLAWMKKHAESYDIRLTLRTDLVMLAVQGPLAAEKIKVLLTPDSQEKVFHLKPFTFLEQDNKFFARTGYTGEDGFEIIFNADSAQEIWNQLLSHEVLPCGLGARDTLRLEAGLNLYGADMDETVTPFEANLAWTVSMEPKERAFIGREKLEEQLKSGVSHTLVGLILEGPGIIRHHQKVFVNESEGQVTSGSYSPTLQKSIALARIPNVSSQTCFVEIRNKQIPAQIIKPPFVKRPKKDKTS